MKRVPIDRIEQLCQIVSISLKGISQRDFSKKPSLIRWRKKEILQLIDGTSLHHYNLSATKHTPVESLQRVCMYGEGKEGTLLVLMQDNEIHLEHHLKQILWVAKIEWTNRLFLSKENEYTSGLTEDY